MHTVEGWAVQYRRNSRCKWRWHDDISGIEVCTLKQQAINDANAYPIDWQTRIVRVRQTAEVIE